MEKGIIEREFELNKQGLKVCITINGNNVSLEFDKGVSFLSKLFRVEQSDDITTIYLAYKKIFRINNGYIDRIYPVSNTEVKVLSAIYYNMKQNKEKDLFSYYKKLKNHISDSVYTMFKKGSGRSKKSEYHANLINILNANELIKFLNEYAIKYPVNGSGFLDFADGKDTEYENIEVNDWEQNIENALRIDLTSDSSYKDQEKAVKNREKLLKKAGEALEDFLSSNSEWCKIEEDLHDSVEKLEQKMVDLENSKANKTKKEQKAINEEKMKVSNELARLKNFKSGYASSIIYNELLNLSLAKLELEKVDYSEISFSNEARLNFMCERHKNDKRFKFFYSIDRLKSVKSFKDAAKSLEGLLDSKMVIGVDLVGLETPIDEDELDEFKEKLEWLLPVLHIHTDSVLKIHGSDFIDSTDNICTTLRIIKEVNNKINETCVDLFGEEWGLIPPPRIIIGNSIDIQNNKELISLLKEFDAVVEFDANTVDKTKLSFEDFDSNGIKYVLFTGSNGIYYQSKNKPNKRKVIKKEPAYPTYNDALDEENIIFNSQGIIDEADKISDELKRFEEYLEDSKPSIDEYYLNEKLNIIKGFAEKRHYLETAKIYLYILEHEVCPTFVSNFKSIQYLSEANEEEGNIDEMSKLYINILGQYNADSESIKAFKE